MNDRKGVGHIVAVLLIATLVLAASEVLYYFSRRLLNGPLDTPSSREVPASSSASIPSSVTRYVSPQRDSATPRPISIRAVSPSSVRAGSSITISGTGFSQLANLTLGGDSHGDGIWLCNKDYCGELYGSDTKIDDDTSILTSVPARVCPGSESNSCSSNFAVAIPTGVYS